MFRVNAHRTTSAEHVPQLALWSVAMDDPRRFETTVPIEEPAQPGPLPMQGGWRPQRELADRNERAVLDAAVRLFAERGVGAVDVREIARTAGVGVGTVYRRFGDKANLLAAVIGDGERDLQDAMLRGEPPLGPGAAPAERLEAFLTALSEFTDANLDVLLAAQASAPGARLRVGAHQAWRLHLSVLLGELRPGSTAADAGWLAEALLAPLAADLYASQRREQGISPERLLRNLLDLARGAAHPPEASGQPCRRGWGSLPVTSSPPPQEGAASCTARGSPRSSRPPPR
ncbi:MAG: TetR/AcrR family transcriptional regulator [Solirubrobacteraceae bacterium]